ncbi:MAG: cytochrome c3 family protein, partial [Thermodesulfobacteriota bacterium]|nr:cytochrome c3 family protein [Thermodesulfobacteriota bacterium]
MIEHPQGSDPRETVFGPYVTAEVPYNGICEICHTSPNVAYYLNDGSGGLHPEYTVGEVTGGPPGTACTLCHTHSAEFNHAGGQPCDACHGQDGGAGTYQSHSTHTENDGDDLKGPHATCPDCHNTSSYPNFADGATTLAATATCDTCHSQGGAFDGVAMAKANWPDGAYEEDGITLQSGKEAWCVSCHDAGSSVCSGVSAPNVDLYYTSGHGRPGANVECLVCHDASVAHIDGEARTYAYSNADLDGNNLVDMLERQNSGVAYAQGYRLQYLGGNVPLMIPWLSGTTFCDDEALIVSSVNRLCFTCHDPSKVFDDEDETGSGLVDTNFKIGPPDPPEAYSSTPSTSTHNMHYTHLVDYTARWYSDWDPENGDQTGFQDSRAACPVCHNVHGAGGTMGSTNEPMIRDGRLAGTSGYGFTYLIEDTAAGGYPWVTSEGATQATGVGANFRYSASEMCRNCHGYGGTAGSSYNAENGEAGIGWYIGPIIYNGVHTGPDSDNTLTVAGTPWIEGELVRATVINVTDGVEETITANTANTVTAVLSSGQWNAGDVAQIREDRRFMEWYRTWQDHLSTNAISGSVGTLDGVTMNGLPGNPVTSGGWYSAIVDPGWSGTVTPTKTGCTFSPESRVYSSVTAWQTSQNFTPSCVTHTISGSVGTLDGVTMKGLPGNPVTTGGGAYSATVCDAWSGTVIPTKGGYRFEPESRDYANVTSGQTNQSYSAISTIIDESFEGKGYEEDFTETVGSSCTVDEDSGIPGTPPDHFGCQCLKTHSRAWGFVARTDLVYPTQQARTFTNFYILIESESLAADGSFEKIFGLYDANGDSVSVLRLSKNTSGDLKFKYRLYNNGASTTVYTSEALSLNTWYKVGIKYDDTSNAYEMRFNDAVVASGSLTGAHRTGVKQWRLGWYPGGNELSGTTYYDKLTVSTDSF